MKLSDRYALQPVVELPASAVDVRGLASIQLPLPPPPLRLLLLPVLPDSLLVLLSPLYV